MNNFLFSRKSYTSEKVVASKTMESLTDQTLVDIGLNRRVIELEDRGQKTSDAMSSLWLVTGGCGRLSLEK